MISVRSTPSICLNEIFEGYLTHTVRNNRNHFKNDTWGCGINKTMIRRTGSAPSALEHVVAHNVELRICSPKQRKLKRRPNFSVVTWNIAAPNNNPFEYWAMHSDAGYNGLMSALQQYIDNPGPNDPEIGSIFTASMYAELRDELARQGTPDLDHLDLVWSEMGSRRAIGEFLKDRSFGEKRLISMPDRMTGSVKLANGLAAFRPSPITGCQNDMSDLSQWWLLWTQYMFRTQINVRGETKESVFRLLDTIPRAKYPALSEAEEALSVPLQTLCLALFDAVFVHVLSSLAPKTWQPLKHSLHKALFERKAALCVSILQEQYGDADIIFIQEASEAFASRAGVCLDHFVLRPSGVDGRRSQLSLILARKSLFLRHTARDVTEEVLRRLPSKCTTAGDLCVFEVATHSEGPYLLASFHGDSDGACTSPVLVALHELAMEWFPNHTLLFGLDANTAAGPADSRLAGLPDRAGGRPGSGAGLDGGGFSALLGKLGLGSCWQGQDLRGLWTTFNARTYLQPQLHKAVGLEGVLDRRHMRLRDWVVFRAGQLAVVAVERDNTGRRGGFERRVMPSQAFPSDHAVVAAVLRRAESGGPAWARRCSTTALP